MTTIEMEMYLNWQNKARKNLGSMPGPTQEGWKAMQLRAIQTCIVHFFFLET